MVYGFVELLYLASDHVHLYVESDGELSVEEIANKIKAFSSSAMLETSKKNSAKAYCRFNLIWMSGYTGFVPSVKMKVISMAGKG